MLQNITETDAKFFAYCRHSLYYSYIFLLLHSTFGKFPLTGIVLFITSPIIEVLHTGSFYRAASLYPSEAKHVLLRELFSQSGYTSNFKPIPYCQNKSSMSSKTPNS